MPPPAPAAPQSATYTRLSAEEYKRALQVFYARSDSHRLVRGLAWNALHRANVPSTYFDRSPARARPASLPHSVHRSLTCQGCGHSILPRNARVAAPQLTHPPLPPAPSRALSPPAAG